MNQRPQQDSSLKSNSRLHVPAPQEIPDAVEGASFPVFIKLISTVGVLLALVWSWHVYQILRISTSTLAALGFLGGGILIVLLGYVGMIIGRTRIDAHRIEQRGLWTKRVDLTDITHIKLVIIPKLSWLIVPRLIVRTKGWRVTTFQAADPRLIEAFYRLAKGA